MFWQKVPHHIHRNPPPFSPQHETQATDPPPPAPTCGVPSLHWFGGGANFQPRYWSEGRGCICANVCSVFERNVSPWTLLIRRTHLFIYTRGALTGTMTSQISNNIKTDIKPGLIRLITNDAHVACTHTHTVYAHARMHVRLSLGQCYHPRQPHT